MIRSCATGQKCWTSPFLTRRTLAAFAHGTAFHCLVVRRHSLWAFPYMMTRRNSTTKCVQDCEPRWHGFHAGSTWPLAPTKTHDFEGVEGANSRTDALDHYVWSVV